MQFIPLEREDQLKEIKEKDGYSVIFKHNTTCPISRGVWRHFETEADQLSNVSSVYVLDLLAHRDLSDTIADVYGVEHQSPQLLLIKNGKCKYTESLYNISVEETSKAIS